MSADRPSLSARDLGSRGRSPRRPSPKARPGLERFEDRQLLAAFLVTSAADAGAGSLRQAILDSNAATAEVNAIGFDLAEGARTIAPTTSLPAITQPVVIDGATQAGYIGTPLIELSGSDGATVGLDVAAPGTVIKGLAVNRFADAGVILGGNGGDTVQSSYIGIGLSGSTPLPNGTGIRVASSNNTIGGTASAEGNRIGFNALGITLGGGGNSVHNNEIAANMGAGIRIDAGAGNNLTSNRLAANGGGGIVSNGVAIPTPVLSAPVDAGSGQRVVQGTVGGATPNQAGYRIQVYGNATPLDGNTAPAQGESLLAETTAASDAQGNVVFSVFYAANDSLPVITATVTGPSGTTSPFSTGVTWVAPTPTTPPPTPVTPPASPTLVVPAPQGVDQGRPLVFGSARGNAVAIQGADLALPVTLSANAGRGTLKLASLAGLTGTGDGTGAIAYTGTVDAVNRALDGLTYTPAAGSEGADALTLTAAPADPSSGATASTAAISLTVRPIASPTITATATVANTPTKGGLVISPAPSAAGAGFYKITDIIGGTLYQADGVTPIGSGTFIAAAQGAAGLKFTPATDFLGLATFRAQASTSADDAGLIGAAAPGSINVGKAASAITITSASSTSYVGGTVTLTAKVTGVTSGIISFYDGVAPLGRAQIKDGQAVLTTRALPNGPHSLTAKFEGNPTTQGSTSLPTVVQVFQTIGAWRGANRNNPPATPTSPTTTTPPKNNNNPTTPTSPTTTPTGSGTPTSTPTPSPTSPAAEVSAPVAPPAVVETPVAAPTATKTTTIGLSYTRKLRGAQARVMLRATVAAADGSMPENGTVTIVIPKKGAVTGAVRNGVATFNLKAKYPSRTTVTAVYQGDSQYLPSVSSTVYVARVAPRAQLARALTYRA